MNNDKKTQMLRYMELIYRKQKGGEQALTVKEEGEVTSLLAEIGLSHEASVKIVTEGILSKMRA